MKAYGESEMYPLLVGVWSVGELLARFGGSRE